METDVKVKVVSDLSHNNIDLKKIIVFCVNVYADPKKSHGSATMIDDVSTRYVRIENTPNYNTQVYALVQDTAKLAVWYPVTTTRSE